MAITLEELTKWAEGKAKRAETPDFSPALEKVKVDLNNDVRDSFFLSQDPDGNPFAPLRDDPFKKPLFGTKAKMIGRVLQAHQLAQVTKTTLEINIDSNIAELHNLGRKKRTKREFLGFGQADHERAAERIADAVAAELVSD